MKQLLLLSFAVGLMACGGNSKKSDSAMGNPCADPCSDPCSADPCGDPCAAGDPCGDPCGGDPCAGGASAAGVNWSGWKSWTKVNNDTFVSKGHKKPWVNVYVTDAAAYKAGGVSQGFAVVKAIHSDDGGKPGDVKMLTVMAKMESGYDSENGDWYYAAMSADGSKVMQEGKLPMCIGCHTGGEDYLFPDKVIGK